MKDFEDSRWCVEFLVGDVLVRCPATLTWTEAKDLQDYLLVKEIQAYRTHHEETK